MSRSVTYSLVALSILIIGCGWSPSTSPMDDPTLVHREAPIQPPSGPAIMAKLTGFQANDHGLLIKAGDIVAIQKDNGSGQDSLLEIACDHDAALGQSFINSRGETISTKPRVGPYILTANVGVDTNLRQAFSLLGTDIDKKGYKSVSLEAFGVSDGVQFDMTGDVIEGGFRQATTECKDRLKFWLTQGAQVYFLTTVVEGNLTYVAIQKEGSDDNAAEAEATAIGISLGVTSRRKEHAEFFLQAGRTKWGAIVSPVPTF